MAAETYLGDGLYGSYDGFMYTLRAPRADGSDHWVGLEPEIVMAFVDLVAMTNLPLLAKILTKYGAEKWSE